MNNISHNILLNSGATMPVLGLGVYNVTDEDEVVTAIKTSVDAGYRLIDTASFYKNEESVGIGIKESAIPREDLFITTKIWNTAQRLGDVEGAFHRSLERLQLDYIDLYLIHWPVQGCFINTWKELEKIFHSGKARSIGVSNFNIHHLEELSAVSDLVPAVNQFEYHPLLNQQELVTYCQNKGIVPQAYSPLARGAYLDNPVIMEIGKKYGKNNVQVGLRWELQHGVAIIPKSSAKERIISNSNIFDFELTEEEMVSIDQQNQNHRINSNPENFDF